MPHIAGPRSPADVALDMFKPFVESALRDHAGSFLMWLPFVGDGLKYAIRTLGRAPVATFAKASSGLFKPPRSWFPSGEMGDQMQRLTHEALGELGQAIAHTAEDISDEDLETRIDETVRQLAARLTGKSGGDPSHGGTNPMDPDVIVWKQGVAGAETYSAHHPSCALLPQTTIEETLPVGGGHPGKPPKKVQKMNPALRKIPRSHAKAQGIHEHGACMKIFVAQAQAEKPAATGKKKPLEIMAELTKKEHAELMTWMSGLTSKQKKYVNHEFEERLTSVAELREILRHPIPLRLAAVGKLKDKVMEKFEKARDELRKGIDRATVTLKKDTKKIRSLRKKLVERRKKLKGDVV